MTEFRVLHVQRFIDAPEYEMLKRSGHLDSYVGNMHRQALADKILRSTALEERIEEVDPKDYRGAHGVTVRHTIGVAMPRDVNAFDQQLREAASKGIADAASQARKAASQYDGLTGPCGHVIAASLNQLARRLDKLASEAARPSVAKIIEPAK